MLDRQFSKGEVHMKIGFMGLGQMGKHMAMNLLKCGEEVVVNDLRTDSYPEFEAKGAKTTTNLKDIAECDIIFLSLPDTKVVKAVLLGQLLGNLKKGQVVADLSTINYTASTEIAKALEEKGVEFMDAPVSGMEARAKDGTVTVMCGGKKEIFDLLMPYFQCMGSNILHMGVHGCGQLTKAINNILFDINIAAFAEILPMAIKLGLDPEQIGSVVNSSSGKSYASEFFIPRILKRNFGDGYPLEHAYKDLVSGAELGAQLCIPLPVMHAATATYQMAMLKGLGLKDKGAMICVFEDLLGVKYENK
ncbi:MAG: 3-hydroxyisobutyrate dehydrogenase [Anaerosporomusa subterranea]|jgi:3-hydroxyisobutyrate dehydrogenase-like beta-hydroxyacid dehydrogenase|nr:3-hydroxyisobutyrate dehydrogenase [Anaerosporomusa subterranea]